MIRDSIFYLIKHKILLLLIVPAMILTLTPFVFDGQNGCIRGICGFIVGSNYRDGIWFQAVAATAFKTFPFQMPNFAGEILQGYHYLPNLVVFLLSQIGIPIALSYYKLIPLFYFFFLTIITIHLGKKIQNSAIFIGLLLFFMYFGMHLSLITSLYHFGYIKNQVLINTFQSTRVLESPHTSIGILILLYIISLLLEKKITQNKTFFITFLIFISFGIKFYIAFSILVICIFFTIFSWHKDRDVAFVIKSIFLYMTGALCGILLFYNPFAGLKSGSTFIFSPFSTVHHIIESPDLFFMSNMVLARYYLYEHGFSPRLLFIELLSSFLFVLYYFGSRIVGFIQIFINIVTKNINKVEISISVSIFISILCSILFIQKGDWFNPIQFAVPAAFLSNIFAAQFIIKLIKSNKIIGYIVLIVIAVITIPANLINLNYLSSPGRLVITKDEMQALDFLKKLPYGVVHAPIDENDMAYVSAFTGKPTFVNFISVLENSGIDYKKRLELSNDLNINEITRQKVRYFYLRNYKSSFCINSNKESIIFKNKSVLICEFKKTS